MSITKCSFYLQNADFLVHSDHELLLKIITGHTDNDKCNTWGLEAAAIPRRVQVQHINGITNVLADAVLRLTAVGLYLDLDFKDHQQEFIAPFHPLPPFEPATHTPLELNEVLFAPNIENLTQNYDALHDLPTAQTNNDAKPSLENVLPADIPQLEESLMSLPELILDKVTKLKK